MNNAGGKRFLSGRTVSPVRQFDFSAVRSSRQLGQDFVVFGKSARLLFGEDRLPLKNDLENAAAAFDQFDGESRLFLHGVRQTGGVRFVVSLNAVGDGNGHGFLFSHGEFKNDSDFVLSRISHHE